MAGVDLFTKKEILGHWDIATTMRYSHLSPGFLHEAVIVIPIKFQCVYYSEYYGIQPRFAKTGGGVRGGGRK